MIYSELLPLRLLRPIDQGKSKKKEIMNNSAMPIFLLKKLNTFCLALQKLLENCVTTV